MSIDDKQEKLYRERRLTERENTKYSSNKELSYEGYTVGPEEYVHVNATQSEPMDFCPECNGMMLPYLDGHKCNGCGFTKGVSEELIKKSEMENASSTRTYSIDVSSFMPKRRSRIIPKVPETEVHSLSPEELDDKLTNLDDDIFDIVVLILGVPKSLEKIDKIEFINNNYRAVRIENAIQHALKIKP